MLDKIKVDSKRLKITITGILMLLMLQTLPVWVIIEATTAGQYDAGQFAWAVYMEIVIVLGSIVYFYIVGETRRPSTSIKFNLGKSDNNYSLFPDNFEDATDSEKIPL